MEQSLTRLKNLVNEAKVNLKYREELREAIHNLHTAYQHKRIDYLSYKKQLDKILAGKGRKEVLDYYDSYIATILGQIEQYSAELFYHIYNDRSFDKQLEELEAQKAPKKEKVEAAEPQPHVVVPKLDVRMVKEETMPLAAEHPKLEHDGDVLPLEPKAEKEAVGGDIRAGQRAVLETKVPAATTEAVVKELVAPLKRKTPLSFLGTAAKAVLSTVKTLFRPRPQTPKHTSLRAEPWLKHDTPSAGEQMREKVEEEVKKVEDFAAAEAKDIFTFSFITHRFKKQGFTVKTTEMEPALAKLRSLKEFHPFADEESDVTETLLRQEAHRIRGIIRQRQKYHIYEPSSLGAIANLTVRRISLFFIENFPDMFKSLYNNLRAANIKILSNTYVNIIVLCVMISFMLFTTLFTAFFSVTQHSFVIGLGRGVVVGLIAAAAIAILFSSYPGMKIKQRRRSINTNLPFAINHMAAVAGSGVTPVAMFRLIAEAKEYEEISVEVEKVVIFVDLYGYDVLTAIKSVAATGPSPELSEFFEGYVSTVETGGDLKSYLRQKADEALLNYRLERQKYLETISTYTDVYTGILIASPLFFVVALTLVNMLGGTIGGFSVSTIMIFGTYAVIPLLNIAFLLFLEATQPEV